MTKTARFPNIGHTLSKLSGVSQDYYDLAGQLLASRDQLGRWTKYAYNLRSWVTATTDPAGNVTSQAFDPAGNETTTTDPSPPHSSYYPQASWERERPERSGHPRFPPAKNAWRHWAVL